MNKYIFFAILIVLVVGFFLVSRLPKKIENESQKKVDDEVQQPENTKPTLEVSASKSAEMKNDNFQIKDTKLGTGESAKVGDKLRVNYTGKLADGSVFDTSKKEGRSPFEFILGAGEVIKGWDQGLVSMKVGGVRTLTIPPELAYGEAGAGPIPPNSTLTFDVELIEIVK